MLESNSQKQNTNKISAAGLLVTLGIIYGDIGTSPLYVFKAILGENAITEEIVLGSLSLIVWTLTLQTTVKYVILTLRADNNGEGGIFSLYALVRRKFKWLYLPAIIGGSTLLADGIITPPISVSSAIEGLRILHPDIPTVPIVISIITALFMIQRFGSKVVGKSFGPMMFIWFTMLAILGIYNFSDDLSIFKSLNPVYGIKLLINHPNSLIILGAVFLCTTGAEALYSDLGHCGKNNIRVSWIFVKTCLILNYMGQGAFLIKHQGEFASRPFFDMMPDWFLISGIVIATSAAIIASQALITGSFTLISEAIRLNFWPKVKLNYPSDSKGQLFVPSVNKLLWAGCIGVVLFFQESEHMEAAYGLAITLTMLMTTLLLTYYLFHKHVNPIIIITFLTVYLVIESAFLTANLTKFSHGGYISLIIAGGIFSIMFIWNKASKIKANLTEYVNLDSYIDKLKDLSNDTSVSKFASNLIFMSSSRDLEKIETKIIYSILQKQPKRADVYWFVHVEITDDPYRLDYKVDVLAKGDVYKITFFLGFRVENRINLYFRKVVEEMVIRNEVDIISRYDSLNKYNIIGDFRFVVLEKYLSHENQLPIYEQLVMDGYFMLKEVATSEEKFFGLDTSLVTVEKVPMVIRPVENIKIHRIETT